VIAGSRNKLAGRVIRIGTMGSIQAGDIVTDLLHMEAVLKELGSPVKAGAGVEAAVEVLDAR
jgi:aspartate aminotransferase-like enzyme